MTASQGNDSAAVIILGYTSATCIVFLMTPQIYHNFKRQSVEGLSLAMVITWHLASILVSGYLIQHDAATPLVIMWTLNALSFVIVEAQFVIYTKINSEPSCVESTAKSCCGALPALVLSLATGVLVLGSWSVCEYAPYWVAISLGSIVPSVLLGIGFIPQIFEIVSTKSSEGISIGITILDLFGCSCGLATVFISSADFGAAVPFIVLISFQVVMAALILCIYPADNIFGTVAMDEIQDDGKGSTLADPRARPIDASANLPAVTPAVISMYGALGQSCVKS